MLYEVRNIKLNLEQADVAEQEAKRSGDYSTFKKAIAEKLGVPKTAISYCSMCKRSIDARDKSAIKIVYSFMAQCNTKARRLNDCKETNEQLFEAFRENRSIEQLCAEYEAGLVDGQPVECARKIQGTPLVVGSGPAGLFCAYILAKCGYGPLVVERGSEISKRIKDVEGYFSGGSLNVESNVQFGEGGAGTFSDGKLTTRINDRRCNMVLEVFAKHGAPEEIKYQAMPHIGTDKLRQVIPNMRAEIERLGGKFLFNTTFVDVGNGTSSSSSDNCNVKKAVLKNNLLGETFEHSTNCIVLAMGHSARDSFEMLLEKNFAIEQKAFSIGARIEHKQSFLDEAQFGKFAGHPALGKATYQLFTRDNDRTAYTFCMCPGGTVVASASEENTIVTNGMSEFARDGENCNSAFVVAVNSNDYGSSHPLAGMYFQRKVEKAAFDYHKDGRAPIQTVGAFIDSRCDSAVEIKRNKVLPAYTGITGPADLNCILPSFISNRMRTALNIFDRKIKGFADKTALLTGCETRTSSPVRLLRNDNFEAIGHTGVFPIGEGAGYAGGIVSAAVDGIRAAEKILLLYSR